MTCRPRISVSPQGGRAAARQGLIGPGQCQAFGGGFKHDLDGYRAPLLYVDPNSTLHISHRELYVAECSIFSDSSRWALMMSPPGSTTEITLHIMFLKSDPLRTVHSHNPAAK